MSRFKINALTGVACAALAGLVTIAGCTSQTVSPSPPPMVSDRTGPGAGASTNLALAAGAERRANCLPHGPVAGGISLLATISGQGRFREVFRRLSGWAGSAARKFPAIRPRRIRVLPDEPRHLHHRHQQHRQPHSRVCHLPAVPGAHPAARRLRERTFEPGQIQIQHR